MGRHPPMEMDEQYKNSFGSLLCLKLIYFLRNLGVMNDLLAQQQCLLVVFL